MGAVMSSDPDGSHVDEVLQEPEAAPCHPSSSPLSPQLSLPRGTSHLGPLIRISDPYNILSPSNASPRVHSSSRLQSMSNAASPMHASSPPLGSDPGVSNLCTEIYFIRHGESSMNTRPELIGGRSPSATLTELGSRQARALGMHLRALGMEFDTVFSSSLERAKQTAYGICQELDIPRESIVLSDALQELSQGQWEGRIRSEIYTPATVPIVNSNQPDFRAPGGESQRQVESRMLEFLNNVVLTRAARKRHSSSNEEVESSCTICKPPPPRGRSGMTKSGLSTMQVHFLEDTVESESTVRDETDLTTEDPAKPQQGQIPDIPSSSNNLSDAVAASAPNDGPYVVAVVSHGLAIKCMLRGLIGFGPNFTSRWCIDNTSLTVVRHSTKKGWEIQRVNDTSHLRLL